MYSLEIMKLRNNLFSASLQNKGYLGLGETRKEAIENLKFEIYDDMKQSEKEFVAELKFLS